MTLKLKKSVSYLKIKNRKINEDNNSESYIQSLKDQILSLENKKCELEEVFTTKKLSYFKNNRYCDKIRMVYEDILCMGLCTHNVEKVIKIVLEKLAGIECDRLPKSTFSKYMLIEARGLAKLQIASQPADCENDLVYSQMAQVKKAIHFLLLILLRVMASFMSWI